VHSQTGSGRGGSASAALPDLGDGTDMTPNAERRLGDRIARELYRDPDYVDDAILSEYVQGIWQPLLRAARRAWRVDT
jgi:predicted Zn-dependent protease